MLSNTSLIHTLRSTGIFQLTQIFGNLISGYIEHVANDKLLFLIYLGMILIGVILVCCVPTLNTFRDKGSKSIVKNVINNITTRFPKFSKASHRNVLKLHLFTSNLQF